MSAHPVKFALPLFTALLACSSAADKPPRYLVSITGFELSDGEGIDAFSIDTWGVEFKAVCRIPWDWEITAGRFGNSGRLSGQAGHGSSWIRSERVDESRALVLIELSAPVQSSERRLGNGVVPATFAGSATILSSRDGGGREMPLSSANLELEASSQCPPLINP